MENGKLKWLITIPANSTGIVVLPSALKYTVNGEKMKDRRFKPAGSEGEFTLRSFPSGQSEIRQEE
jgi:alpha-L-rhamnosidase